ncbi:MAG TPA: carboxymuconolactone decarboxylase family protein [Spirochaetota bacterium]|nr:carboxymuconolactone decarboxylase family protein [Spirochaetota bacterium]HPL18089.1 carboxymuconolactone decarboxylase family protein [Spirochaetota bacterium]HQF10586.1 carboxymuconolactone decarboxylase family protein [Spirochaetota bacterium]HQH99562.1 carboxymuconolactone decarboxylase family protein [Spirochaetota bacterium]HRS79563.1 carboxymuconolactone decarboxylase family protein [Spirochaetota bacterium]
MISVGVQNDSILNERTRELIAVGASIAGNCMPCLRYHFAEALKQGCSLEEINEAMQLARQVKERPLNDIYKLSEELMKKEKDKGANNNAGI